MGYIAQTRDLTKQYTSFDRVIDSFRPVAATTYLSGMCVQLVSQDQQVYPDEATIAPAGTAANQQLLVGLVSETWNGFDGSVGAANFTSASNSATVRGTQGVDVNVGGFHPGGLVDQSGAGAAAISNGTPLIPSRATSGYMQGGTAVGGMGTAAVAMLPAAGLASSLTAAALAQASQTVTIAGAPAAGDTLSVTLQTQYSTSAPGVAQTLTFTTPGLTAAQAASATTAAAALVAYLNAQPAFSQYFTASNAAGVVTIAVNANAASFLITFGSGSNVTNQITVALSGSAANGLTIASAATGGSTATAGGASLAGGAGYKGPIPVCVV